MITAEQAKALGIRGTQEWRDATAEIDSQLCLMSAGWSNFVKIRVRTCLIEALVDDYSPHWAVNVSGGSGPLRFVILQSKAP